MADSPAAKDKRRPQGNNLDDGTLDVLRGHQGRQILLKRIELFLRTARHEIHSRKHSTSFPLQRFTNPFTKRRSPIPEIPLGHP
jgi:hypothetical protein